MTAQFTHVTSGPSLPFKLTLKGTVAALKPNYLKVIITGDVPGQGKVERRYVSNGKEYYTYSNPPNAYRKDTIAPKPDEFLGEWEGEIDAFFGGEANAVKGQVQFVKTEKVDGVLCDVVKMTLAPRDGAPARTLTYTIGQADKLIHRASYPIPTTDGGNISQINTISTVNLSAKLSPKDFLFTPPKDSKQSVPQRRREVIFAPNTKTQSPAKG
jgi:outer membrane lipoprotein-sorting protein